MSVDPLIFTRWVCFGVGIVCYFASVFMAIDAKGRPAWFVSAAVIALVACIAAGVGFGVKLA